VAILLIGYTPQKGLTKTEQKQPSVKYFLPSFKPMLAFVIIWDTRRKIFNFRSDFYDDFAMSSQVPA
jgi:hypothetical protein